MNSSTNLCLKKEFIFVLGLSMTFTHIWQISAGLIIKEKINKNIQCTIVASKVNHNKNNSVKLVLLW